MKISRRRVQQIWKSYAESKKEPAIGENMGGPGLFDEREAEVVGEAYQLYSFGARMLEVAVRKVFKILRSLRNGTTIDRMVVLSLNISKTPERAFRRKMRLEMYFAIGQRLFGPEQRGTYSTLKFI